MIYSSFKKYILLPFIIFAFSCKKNVSEYTYTNELINESSPYLLQHAHNPVNWYPWKNQYLEKAKKENKLILLSIGYSSCHWCHVMEKETFEDKEVAEFMNTHFINIKVDREEHPNVDKTYLTAVKVMTGNGGWPLNCILLPNGEPLWGGTYFNKENWLNALQNIQAIYAEDPEQAKEFATRLSKDLISLQTVSNNQKNINFSTDTLKVFINDWKQSLDTINGGLVGKNQFPRPSSYQFLLRYSHQTNDTLLQQFVFKTLDKIALGGLNDPIEGGFARYTVDNKWHIPHFEKMLYDNAQLISLFSNAYQLSKNERYKKIVYNTLHFTDTNLHKNDLYFSSLNADSFNENNELEEGAYYTWKKDSLQTFIKDDFELFSDYFGIDKIEKLENKHVLLQIYRDSVFAKKHQLKLDELNTKVSSWKKILLEKRANRVAPELDNKILTSWNALMLQALTDAYKVFGDESIKKKAIKNAIALKNKAISNDGSVYRSINSENNKIKGTMEDYALLINSYISLYQITFDESWLQTANKLTEYVLKNFYDKNKGFFYPLKENQNSIMNNLNIEDIVIPSANSVMNKNLFFLSHYFDHKNYADISYKMLHNILPKIKKHPYSYSNWLDSYLNLSLPFYETVIAGENALEKSKELNNYYIPNQLLSGSTQKSELPLLKGRFTDSNTFIYVCVNKTCKLPTDDIKKAREMLTKQ
ncbi:thioredoxin domain-containing protein [Tenacibaculum sp. M341]|uniref:thioredoxin domain-containing protein n=1 Tax=Tenacibaculum sp. M341 TaxID=2530339 RepID=UPI001043F6DE|nr:thioredoxin domain-containing protein [Tenacibaculum sp. M341]TCI90352.1 thioredoxin domain-containing protein [Tenacibaculum sp. M341]